jgi:CubicO group peptidase (beta-lactamase class C family)
MSVIDMEKTADHSWAYTEEDKKLKVIPYRNIDAIAPAGAINSCAKDMANWLITWINNGKFNGNEILPATYRNQALTVQMATGGGCRTGKCCCS